MKNFWQNLPKPFFVLAPMDDVTDVVFRQVVVKAAPPDVLFTEFTSVEGLQSPGRGSTLERLRIEPNLKLPLVAQIWGSNPDNYRKTAEELAAMGFAGIDINMGCPEKGAVKRGEGGGMIGLYDKAAAVIAATKEGAGELPVSVKTRIGLRHAITEEWAGFLLGQGIAALTIHGRTVKEMSKVPARWEEIQKVVQIRDRMGLGALIIGNGDVENRAHGLELIKRTGADGVMIGRGVFHNLFAFDPSPLPHSPTEMLKILLDHVGIYEQMNSQKSFQTLKRFFKIYVNGWPGSADLRAKLMETKTPDEVRAVVSSLGDLSKLPENVKVSRFETQIGPIV